MKRLIDDGDDAEGRNATVNADQGASNASVYMGMKHVRLLSHDDHTTCFHVEVS
jgi:hypothetical protein